MSKRKKKAAEPTVVEDVVSDDYTRGLADGYAEGEQETYNATKDALVRGISHLMAGVYKDDTLKKKERKIMLGMAQAISDAVASGELLVEQQEIPS